MTTDDAPGPRIDAAKTAANQLIQALAVGSTFGLLTYGTGTGSSDAEQAAGCRDVKTLVPQGPLDRSAATAQVNGLQPRGYTPISLALQHAADMLPGTGTQSIMLVSDGEDTCGQPPCDTAKALKASHPGLAISTVGFKTTGSASDDLACIAQATGGLSVTAANAQQLAARLLATQDIDAAQSTLTSTGFSGVNIGDTIAELKQRLPDFPDASATDKVVVVWKDCDLTFEGGILVSITPHDGGHTIDGISAGSSVADATRMYGDPVATTDDGDNATLTYTADADKQTAYEMRVKQFRNNGGNPAGTITTITLCRCLPESGGSSPEQIVLKPVDARGSTQPGWTKNNSRRDSPIDCSYGTPSPYDVTTGVRWCGTTADSGDACWPTADNAYVLCLQDPFSKALFLISANGLSTPRTALKYDPVPFALVLDDGTTCRARIGGAWGYNGEHPDWIAFYGCGTATTFGAVWAPSGGDRGGITKAADGWSVFVGPTDGHLTQHKIVTVYYVGVA